LRSLLALPLRPAAAPPSFHAVDGAGAGDRLEGLAAAAAGGERVAWSPNRTLMLTLPALSTVSSAETAAIAATCKKT